MSSIKLRPYQQLAVDETRRLISTGVRRVLINAATGAGKTLIGADILAGAVRKGSPTLFLAHRRELIDQSAGKVHDAGIMDYGIIMSGSRRNNAGALVQIASIQTLIKRELPPARIIMIDEAHRAAAKTYRDIVANYPGAAIIGLSATPERTDGKGLDDLFDEMVTVSSIPELIADGYLMAPTCYVGKLAADLNGIKTRGGDYAEGALQDAVDKPQLIGDIVTEWVRHAEGRQSVVFAAGVEHSQHIAQAFLDAGIPAASVDGSTPPSERESIIRDWKAGYLRVVSNCMIFTEGFDYPGLEACVLARPTKSISLYLQMVGRIMRSMDGKRDPLVLDHAGCVERFGPPSIHREWDLAGEVARRNKNEDNDTIICESCQMVFNPETTFYLAPVQAAIKEDYASAAKSLFQRSAKRDRRLALCSGCGACKCPVCQESFKPSVYQEIVEGDFFINLIDCPTCGARYGEDAAHEKTDADVRGEIMAADGSLIEYDGPDVPPSVLIVNEFRRLMKIARQKEWKRGRVWHLLADQYSPDQLRAALPKHRAEWWRDKA